MPRNYSRALVLTAAVICACERSTPAERAARTDSAPPDTAQPAVPAASPPADTSPTPAPPVVATRPRDTTTPSPGKPAAAPAPTPAAPAAPAPARPSPPADTTATAPVRDIYHTAPLDTVDERTYQGWKQYSLNCARCHGEDVMGTTIAPHLITSLKPDGPIPDAAAFQVVVCGGRVDKGMPAWCALGMMPAQIDTIYAYVKGRSDGKLHPGRPARRGS